jgi:dihydroorotate dehydrogenase electron transfer subunit
MAATSHSIERDASRPRRLDLRVAGRLPAGRDFTRLVLDAPADWLSLPGQFVNVLCESDARAVLASENRPLDDADAADWPQATGLELSRRWPLVRRPLSISRVRRAGGDVRLELLVRTVGCGTRWLANRAVGATLDVVGPLGNAFAPPADERLCVLLGGGCGMAPIFGLADALTDLGRKCVLILGARTVADVPLALDAGAERIAAAECPGADLRLATDDGSAGFRGTAVAALAALLDGEAAGRPVALYGCGPEPMLMALAQLAVARGLPCQVSLEGFMGCGIGVCLSCARKRRDPSNEKGWTLKLTCRDGPVVDARELV